MSGDRELLTTVDIGDGDVALIYGTDLPVQTIGFYDMSGTEKEALRLAGDCNVSRIDPVLIEYDGKRYMLIEFCVIPKSSKVRFPDWMRGYDLLWTESPYSGILVNLYDSWYRDYLRINKVFVYGFTVVPKELVDQQDCSHCQVLPMSNDAL